MPISVIKSGAACGAQIVFDLSQPIDEPGFREIEAAFHDNIVVVFLRPEAHIGATNRVQPPLR